MNFKLTKKKVTWTLAISILGSILSLYLISPGIGYKTGIKDISIGTLSSIKPSAILYLMLFFIATYLIWSIVIYVIWSLSEGDN